MKALEPFVGLLAWREECIPTSATTWRIPAYGFLSGIELTLMEPIPNMNTQSHVELVASLEVDGTTVQTGEPLPALTPGSRAIVRAELRVDGTPIRFGTCIAKFHQVADPVTADAAWRRGK